MDEKLEQFINSEKLSDVRFEVGSEKKLIHGHKFIFAAHSDAFKSMLYGDLAETRMPIVIPDITPTSFLNMMKYLYTMKIDFELHNLYDVYVASDKYQIDNLNDKIFEYIKIKLNKSNACLILDQLCKMGKVDDDEFRYVNSFVRLNSDSAFKSDYFNEISESTLINLLNFEYLNINEVDILKSCAKWVNNQISKNELEPTLENKVKIFEPIKNHILFSKINPDDLRNFKEIDNLLNDLEITNLFLNLYCSNKRRPLIKCETSRKPLKCVQSNSNYNSHSNYNISQFTMNFKINYEIVILSIQLKLNLDGLRLKILENNYELNLIFDCFIGENGNSCINFLENFIFKSSIDYKLVFRFTSKNFDVRYFSGKSDLNLKDEDSDNEIIFNFSATPDNYHIIDKINFIV